MTIDSRPPAPNSGGVGASKTFPLAPPELGAGGAALDKPHAELKKAAQGFEAHFLHTLLTEMRKTLPDSKLIPDGGQQKDIFQDMLDQTLADNMAQRGDFGLADLLYKQMAPALGSAPEAAPEDGR